MHVVRLSNISSKPEGKQMLLNFLHRNTRCAIGDVIRKVDEKLCQAALSGGVVAEYGGECRIAQRFGKALTQRLSRPAVITQATEVSIWRTKPSYAIQGKSWQDSPKEAAHYMLEKPYCLLLNKLSNHITQNGSNCIEPLIRCANIREADVVEENLLHDENCNGLAKF